MMSVAARLVRALPVVDRDFRSDEWGEWLERHSLICPDGRWLADLRDPSPAKRRDWTQQPASELWRWGITADDFVDCLWRQTSKRDWLFVGGHWVDVHDGYTESVRIMSALVNPEAAESLASSLRWSRSPQDYRLPHYQSDDREFSRLPFKLTGWLRHVDNHDPGLGQSDPHARKIEYPAIEIGPAIAEQLKLTPDVERRVWRQSARSLPALRSEIWSERQESEYDRDDEMYRSGKRMSASADTLIKMCKRLKCSVILEVQIDRGSKRAHHDRSIEDFGYIPSSHKIFVFSSDGILRDAEKNYRIG